MFLTSYTEIGIASLLTILTMGCIIHVANTIFKMKYPKKNKENKEETENKKSTDGKGYADCKINKVMGYEFIKVQRSKTITTVSQDTEKNGAATPGLGMDKCSSIRKENPLMTTGSREETGENAEHNSEHDTSQEQHINQTDTTRNNPDRTVENDDKKNEIVPPTKKRPTVNPDNIGGRMWPEERNNNQNNDIDTFINDQTEKNEEDETEESQDEEREDLMNKLKESMKTTPEQEESLKSLQNVTPKKKKGPIEN